VAGRRPPPVVLPSARRRGTRRARLQRLRSRAMVRRGARHRRDGAGAALSRFVRYNVLERMAIGGMAEVFRARGIGADGSSTPVVLKKILSAYSQDAEFRRMFRDEALITAVLRH